MTSTLLSRLDLSNGEVRKDCAEALRRARDLGSPGDLATWAEHWGPAVADALIGGELEVDRLRDEIVELESELEEAGGPPSGLPPEDLRDLKSAIEKARSAVDAGEDVACILELFDALEDIVDDLPVDA